ncbi:hypothetical protein [Leifsonia sp. NPDC058248]|uniref:hypothetical protein n=1 Tax=Leifsonia sp. NPDC058248 TaxID=3346402 RepID=UPI0036DB9B5D
MSDPRYRPCDWVLVPRDFGEQEDPRWEKRPEKAGDRARYDASVLQHMVALRVRYRTERASMNWKAVAFASGISYDRLVRVLHGQVVMRLEDVARLEEVLGPVLHIDRVSVRGYRKGRAERVGTVWPEAAGR